MGNSISNNVVINQCLKLLKMEDFRHPFADTGVKKLLTGKAIMLLVEAQLRKHESLWDIAENLKAKESLQKSTKLESVHYSTIHRRIESLPTEVLQEMCSTIFRLISSHYSDKKGIGNIGKIRIIDASKITLPDVAGKWAYCTRHENSVKIHLRYVLADENTAFPDKMVLSTGAVSDSEGATTLVVDKDAIYVFDRGYINYHLYHKWKQESISFATRVKAGSKLKILEQRSIPEDTIIERDCDVEILDPKTKEPFTLRLVEYKDDQGKLYRIVTNRWNVSAFEISEVYRYRWKIELFFKWMKQHLKLVKLYNHSPDAVWNQIYIAMIAYGLCELIKIQTGTTISTWQVLKHLRHYWFDDWETFLSALFRNPTRTSKGRIKKGKRGRPRKYPKKYKAVQIIVK